MTERREALLERKYNPNSSEIYKPTTGVMELHPSFTAGSHIISSNQHILYRSTEGTLWRHIGARSDNIDVEFDVDTAIDQTFKNVDLFECGVFTTKGAFVASHPEDTGTAYFSGPDGASTLTHSLIKFRRYDKSDRYLSDWEYFLPDGSHVVAVAQTDKKYICACSNGKIYIYLQSGIIHSTFTHPFKIVTIIAHKNQLAVFHQDLGIQTHRAIKITIYDISSFPARECDEESVPVQGQLEWAGFTKWGIPAIQDSSGKVSMWINENWITVCQIKETQRILTIDLDGATTLSIEEPRGVFEEHELGNFLIAKGPKSVMSISKDLRRL